MHARLPREMPRHASANISSFFISRAPLHYVTHLRASAASASAGAVDRHNRVNTFLQVFPHFHGAIFVSSRRRAEFSSPALFYRSYYYAAELTRFRSRAARAEQQAMPAHHFYFGHAR